MSVHTKLNRARMELAKRKLEKTGLNKFAGYKYFELGDFLLPVQEIFNEVGLCGVVSFTADIATLTITDTEDNSQVVLTSPMGSAALKGVHEVQNIGAVETYQRRYLWVAALEIVEHDALDATTGKDRNIAKEGTLHHAVRDGIGEDLPQEDKDFLKELADWCVRNIGEPVKVAQHIASQKLYDDQRIYLENQMDSKTRAAIKKAEEEVRKTFSKPTKVAA